MEPEDSKGNETLFVNGVPMEEAKCEIGYTADSFNSVAEHINRLGFTVRISAEQFHALMVLFGIKHICTSRRFRTGITPKPNRTRRRQRHTRLQRRHNRQNKNRRKA